MLTRARRNARPSTVYDDRTRQWIFDVEEATETPVSEDTPRRIQPTHQEQTDEHPNESEHSTSRSTSSCRRSSASSVRSRLRRESEVMQVERKMAERERLRDLDELARVRRLADLKEEAEEEEAREEEEEDAVRFNRPILGPFRPPVPTEDSFKSKASGTQIAKCIAETLERHSNLPKPELMTFGGQPSDYPRFMHNFDTTIDRSDISDSVKLGYLIQHCYGDAKRCIEDCVVLEPAEGYLKAKELLRTHFGRPWLVAEQFISRLDGPSIKASDQKGLRDLCLDLTKCTLNLGQLGFKAQVDSYDTLRRVVRRLPYSMRNQWVELAHRISEKGRVASLEDLAGFVKEREAAAASLFGRDLQRDRRSDDERGEKPKPRHPGDRVNPRHPGDRVTTMATISQQNQSPSSAPNYRCPACGGSCANLDACQDFARQSLDERRSLARSSDRCYNCLRPGHVARRCNAPPCPVDGCGYHHHQLLHKWTTSAASPSPANAALVSAVSERQSGVYLGIIPVTLHGANGNVVQTCALLDNGSSQSFVDAALLQRLNMKGKPLKYRISTLTAANEERNGAEVDLPVSSSSSVGQVLLRKVWSVPSLALSSNRAADPKDVRRFPHLKDLPLQESTKSPIGLLIGAGSEALTPLEVRSSGRAGEPYAERTLLGWVVRGPSCQPSEGVHADAHYLQADDVQGNLERMWNTEFSEILHEKAAPSKEDQIALKGMEQSIQRRDGHYEIALPWKDDVSLTSNKAHAHIRLQQLKRRLSRNPDLKSMYCSQMDEYLREGYAEKAPAVPSGTRNWYLPHHPVCNDQKPGKVRVVFDGAARFKGKSLNDQLLQGPDLCNNLAGILMRFRKHPVAVTADIKAMYHQVLVPEKDRDALRFLWWPGGDISQEPREYRMTRHVFGLRSSPSCAAYALRRAATDNSTQYNDEVVNSILEDFYVDDFLRSFSDLQEASAVGQDLVNLLSKGGFNLVKWSSNSLELIDSIPQTHRAPAVRDIALSGQLPCEKTLGMLWNANTDAFGFSIQIKTRPLTKRGILSVVSSLYDPLGLVAPVTLEAKLLLQDLTRRRATWDEAITDTECRSWERWKAKLPTLEGLSIARMYVPRTNETHEAPREFELHVFCDASESAYGACAYLRTVTKDSSHCSLVMGKSRLAPIRQFSIPRLELTAAMVASRLRGLVVNDLGIELQRTVMWTDSMITLGYIRNSTARFKTFVANRLATIHDHTQPTEWRYVPTKDNPADLASRGFAADDTNACIRWLHGPLFLVKNENEWPHEAVCAKSQPDVRTPDPEVREVMAIDADPTDDVMMQFCLRYSTLRKVVRSVAWWLRYLHILQQKTLDPLRQGTRPLITEEITAAEALLVKSAQHRNFTAECDLLSKGQQVRTASRLASLDPQLKDALLCTGSRLRFANITLVILPDRDPLTSLIIRDAHVENGHVGTEQVLASLRSRYWILKGRSAVRRELADCRLCRRLKAPPAEQQMAPVLREQLTPDSPPFSYVGVDLFGPLQVKQSRSVVKRYGVIFTCLTTRAVHYEVTHSLNTDSFLGSVSRFIARRGTPRKMFSDRGTNLTAAEKEIKEGIRQWSEHTIGSTLAQRRIAWHFNPPHASHMGGLWERLIRSTRSILRSLVGQQLLTDEGLLTVLAEVERIMNDRPITHVSTDPRDPEVLTPSKLLLLRGDTALPLGLFDVNEPYARRWWKQAQYLSGIFWRRWVKEYVPLLIARQKWHRPRRNLTVGDVVLIADLHQPRGRWPLGVIREVKIGRDGLCRSATVKTESTTLIRPATQLCLLEAAE